MTKVQLTKNEYDYLESFGGRKNKAIFYISRYGWSYDLEDGRDRTYSDAGERWDNVLFNGDFDEVRLKLIRAVLDGYELKEELYYINVPNVYHGDLGYHRDFGTYSFYNKEKLEGDGTVRFELTKEEIKENNAELWQFAKYVEEVSDNF